MNCPALDIETGGLATALRAIDCRTGDATAHAFDTLFGTHGALLPALTGLLTLYVAIFAIGLLTGRARIGLSSLTPRMLTLGLVLTFATSWLAYQHVVWALATGAPDEIATLLAGTKGSATSAFADRLDTIFSAITESARQTEAAVAATTATAATPGGPPVAPVFTSHNLLWMSGLMLLVGTVGVLVTAKVALAALLAVGPVFIVLAIFPATRGLFEGWLKAVLGFALVPLFTVLIGGATLALITPLIRTALMDSTETAARGATGLFLAACVYCALMAIVTRTTTMLVSGWRLPFGAAPEPAAGFAGTVAVAPIPVTPIGAPPAAASASGDRVRAMLASLPAGSPDAAPAGAPAAMRARRVAAEILPAMPAPSAPAVDHRLQGVGSRFRAAPATPSRLRLS